MSLDPVLEAALGLGRLTAVRAHVLRVRLVGILLDRGSSEREAVKRAWSLVAGLSGDEVAAVRGMLADFRELADKGA